MDRSADHSTSPTLLGRLKQSPRDPLAWQRFAEQYGPRIVDWGRRWGLQPADAEDLAQTVMLKLVGAMQRFEYDPSQRYLAWLKTVVHNAWKDFVTPSGSPALDGPLAEEALYSVAARDDLSQSLIDSWRQELLQEAFARVRLRVADDTWQAFALTRIEGLGVAEAADRLSRPLTLIYKARSNVARMIREEFEYLEQNHA